MKKLMPGGGVAIIGSHRFAPGYPFPHSSRPCTLEFWENEIDFKHCASLEWTDALGQPWNYSYRLWDSYFVAQADVIYASGGGIDPDSRLMGGEFYNWILRGTLVAKEPAF